MSVWWWWWPMKFREGLKWLYENLDSWQNRYSYLQRKRKKMQTGFDFGSWNENSFGRKKTYKTTVDYANYNHKPYGVTAEEEEESTISFSATLKCNQIQCHLICQDTNILKWEKQTRIGIPFTLILVLCILAPPRWCSPIYIHTYKQSILHFSS